MRRGWNALMTLELSFPIEFIIAGTPVSLQTKRAEARKNWQETIRSACAPSLPEGHFASENRIAITLFYFPDGEMRGDIDNIVKPILDAFSRHIYMDDRQVDRILVQKFEPEKIFAFAAPSPILARAIAGPKPLLYVRLSDDPTEELG